MGSAQGGRLGGEHHFSAQQRLAQRGWQVIAPDRPGHGRSAAPGRPDDAEADGAWVADLLDGGSHLVGHSFGGCVVLAAAASRPLAVRSLTLIEPGIAGSRHG
ncbi:MAG: alpha/beta fold hydrolase [Steroidobacteraceae bacterium]